LKSFNSEIYIEAGHAQLEHDDVAGLFEIIQGVLICGWRSWGWLASLWDELAIKQANIR
jgi:hypothetical protein